MTRTRELKSIPTAAWMLGEPSLQAEGCIKGRDTRSTAVSSKPISYRDLKKLADSGRKSTN